MPSRRFHAILAPPCKKKVKKTFLVDVKDILVLLHCSCVPAPYSGTHDEALRAKMRDCKFWIYSESVAISIYAFCVRVWVLPMDLFSVDGFGRLVAAWLAIDSQALSL